MIYLALFILATDATLLVLLAVLIRESRPFRMITKRHIEVKEYFKPL